MARITVEDCIDKFPSRFELVLVASNRARKLHSGEEPTVEKDNDKNTVIALREIANETITVEKIKNDLIEEYQTTSFSDDELNENLEDDVQNQDNLIEDQNEDHQTSDINDDSSFSNEEPINETSNNDTAEEINIESDNIDSEKKIIEDN